MDKQVFIDRLNERKKRYKDCSSYPAFGLEARVLEIDELLEWLNKPDAGMESNEPTLPPAPPLQHTNVRKYLDSEYGRLPKIIEEGGNGGALLGWMLDPESGRFRIFTNCSSGTPYWGNPDLYTFEINENQQ